MKKKALLFSVTALMGYVVLQSNATNPATNAAGNRTGAQGTTSNCGGGGCHGGSGAATTATIRVDSVGGVQVNQYVAGMTYTVTVTGAHTSFTKFGFEFAAVSGSPEVQAGTYGTMPSSVSKVTLPAPASLDIINQTAAITGPLSKVFTWTAPATGVGPIKMYLTVNALDGVGGANSADVSANTVKTLTQKVSSGAVGDVANNIVVNVFPNPVVNILNIQVGNAFDKYNVQVFDMMGRVVSSSTINANASGTTAINTSDWANGQYSVVVANETSRKVIQVVKQ